MATFSEGGQVATFSVGGQLGNFSEGGQLATFSGGGQLTTLSEANFEKKVGIVLPILTARTPTKFTDRYDKTVFVVSRYKGAREIRSNRCSRCRLKRNRISLHEVGCNLASAYCRHFSCREM